jgi:hypothetical protein
MFDQMFHQMFHQMSYQMFYHMPNVFLMFDHMFFTCTPNVN